LGQLGDGTTLNRGIPRLIEGVFKTRVVDGVATGLDHSVFWTQDALWWGAGGNHGGQAGNKSTDSPIAFGPVEATAFMDLFKKIEDKPRKVLCGEGTTYFLTVKNKIYSFGVNSWGQLGDGTQKTNVVGATLRTDDNGDFAGRLILDMATGAQHVIVMTDGASSTFLSLFIVVVVLLLL